MQRLAAEGAERILRECLGLDGGDVLALFWDATAAAPARIIAEAAQRLGIVLRERRLSFRQQQRFDRGAGLPEQDCEALETSRGVLTCLSNNPKFTSYRGALISAGTTSGVRFGHMPGIDMWVLASAVNIDYAATEQRCGDLALALSIGQRARLETYANANDDATGERLEFDLGGLTRSAISSTGRIPMGTWGNIPGGETFIAPMEDTAEGVFVLNGSFKDHVLQSATALRLHFQRGKLTQTDGPPSVRLAFNRLLARGRRQHDPHFDSLAELGVGVNPGIPELTGNALFDEKCDGTVHIALGDSFRYGGRQVSIIHEDLVTRRPSLWIDDRQVLDRGRNVFDPGVWREQLDATEVAEPVTALHFWIRRTVVRADFGAQGHLSVRREVAAGRICSYVIGDMETSCVLALLYELVPPLPASISIADVIANAAVIQMPEALVRPALTILLRHQMIEILPVALRHA
jgi:hypothetical protein